LSRKDNLLGCYAAPVSVDVAHEHDLASHASLPEQFVGLSCLGKRKSLRDEWFNLLLLKEVEQGDQILSKQCRLQPFEPLDTVGDYPFPAREKPATDNIQSENADSAKSMPTI
jgi:hypothetical protein